MPRNPLAGSERTPLPGARAVGKADPSERLEVTLVLRHREHEALQERVRNIAAGDKSERHLTHDECTPSNSERIRPISKQSNNSRTITVWPSSRSTRAGGR